MSNTPLIYDLTNRSISQAVAGSYPITLANSGANNNDVLQLNKSPSGSQSGKGLAITLNSNATGTALDIANSGTGNSLTMNGTSPVVVSQSAGTTGTPKLLVLTGAAHTGITSGTEVSDYTFDSAQTKTWATGAITTQRGALFKAPTYAFAASSTITNAATFAIDNAPTAGTNATITNAYALWVQAGLTELDGRATISGTSTATTTSILQVTQTAASSGTPKILTVTGAANTGMTNAEAIDVAFALGQTKTFTGGGGAIATQRAVRIVAPTYAASAAQTITAASTFAITDAPAAGTNITLTSSYALWVQAGLTQLDGNLAVTGTSTTTTNPIFNLTQTAATTGTPRLATITGGAHTGLTNAEAIDVNLTLARTVTFSGGGGAFGNQRAFRISNPTYAASAAQTITNAATVAVVGAPVAGTNITLTNSYALWVQAGLTQLDGGLTVTGASTLATFTASAASSGTPTTLTVTGAAHTGLTASTEVTQSLHDFSQTYTWATGALTTQRFNLFKAPTIAFNAASTVTTAATLAIDNAPQAGTNATLTNSHALWVQAGYAQFDGKLGITGTSTAGGANGILNIVQAAATTGTPRGITFVGGAHTTLTAAPSTDVLFACARTIQYTGGTPFASLFPAVRITAPTIAFTSATTVTAAATLSVQQGPVAGTNATITNTYSAWFESKIRIDAGVALGGGATATLGTIGGSGPTTASQNQWIEIHTASGVRFVPAWS